MREHRARTASIVLTLILLAAAQSPAWAQSDPAKPGAAPAASQSGSSPTPPAAPGGTAPRPEDLEPGVNTSATPSSATPPEPRPAPSAVGAPAPKAVGTPVESASKGERRTSTASRSQKSTSEGAKAGNTVPQPPRSGAGSGKAHDTLELDTTDITGNRELPKVLYIVPWKRSDLGDLVGKPVNSLLDEVLTPVDRDVFRRQNRYYDALKPDSAKSAAAAGSGEKP